MFEFDGIVVVVVVVDWGSTSFGVGIVVGSGNMHLGVGVGAVVGEGQEQSGRMGFVGGDGMVGGANGGVVGILGVDAVDAVVVVVEMVVAVARLSVVMGLQFLLEVEEGVHTREPIRIDTPADICVCETSNQERNRATNARHTIRGSGGQWPSFGALMVYITTCLLWCMHLWPFMSKNCKTYSLNSRLYSRNTGMTLVQR